MAKTKNSLTTYKNREHSHDQRGNKSAPRCMKTPAYIIRLPPNHRQFFSEGVWYRSYEDRK